MEELDVDNRLPICGVCYMPDASVRLREPKGTDAAGRRWVVCACPVGCCYRCAYNAVARAGLTYEREEGDPPPQGDA